MIKRAHIPHFPSTESKYVAQQVCRNPDQAYPILQRYGRDVADYYAWHGVDWHRQSPAQKEKMALLRRHLVSTSMSPLVLGIEVEMAKVVEELRSDDKLVTARPQAANDDVIISKYGLFDGRNHLFLSNMAPIADEASRRFLTNKQHRDWILPILSAYANFYYEERCHPETHVGFYAAAGGDKLQVAATMLSSHIKAASVTVLGVLAAAGKHALLWNAESGPYGAVMEKAAQLSQVAGGTASFNERFFPTQTVDTKDPPLCAFTHDEQKIATNSIWRINPSRDAGRFCPATKEGLWVPNADSIIMSDAALLRIKSASAVANESLWYGYDVLPNAHTAA